MHQMYSHGRVAAELQMLLTNAETHKIRHAPHTLSSEHAAKLLDRWPDLHVCVDQMHACCVCSYVCGQ